MEIPHEAQERVHRGGLIRARVALTESIGIDRSRYRSGSGEVEGFGVL